MSDEVASLHLKRMLKLCGYMLPWPCPTVAHTRGLGLGLGLWLWLWLGLGVMC